MKTHLLLITGIAFLLGACTTGTMVSSSKGYDDVYFTPGDNPPSSVVNPSPRRDINEASVASKNNQDRAARVVDEYFNQDQSNSGQDRSNTYSYRNENENSYRNENSNVPDSLYQGDENEDMEIEDDGSEELSYSTRIRTFYDPYMYDPFWDSYYGWNMGWGYGGWYAGWNSPWYYGGWYDPWYAYGWGYPYWGGYYGGYYGNYWGGHHGHWNNWYGGDHYFGKQNFAGNYGRRSNAVSYGSNYSVRSSTIRGNNSGNSAFTGRRSSAVAPNYSARQSGNRYTVDPNVSTRSARISQPRNNETLLNLRRSGTRQGYTPSTRSAQTGQDNSQRYTPTYSRPRANTQATYNNGARDYGRQPQYRSSESSRYAKPGSYSSAPSRYSGNSNTGATYQRRSATINSQSNSSERTYSSPAYSAPSRSSESYSSPSRGSYSGGSYSGGGGSNSGGGGGSFSGRRR